MDRASEYQQIIISKARVVICSPYRLTWVRRVREQVIRHINYYGKKLHTLQRKLEQSGLYTEDPICCQAKIDSAIQEVSQTLDSYRPMRTAGTYINVRIAELKGVMNKLLGDKCEPETDPSARLSLKLKAVEIWPPILELLKFLIILIDYFTTISEHTRANERHNQSDSSPVQGAKKLRLS